MINESPEEQFDIHSKLNTPIIHSDLNRLLLASSSTIGVDSSIMNQLGYESILTIQLYIKIEEELRDSQYIEKGMSMSEIEREHIFHKLLFDSLNENLDFSRVGGLKGIPPTFSNTYQKLKPVTPHECAFILEQSKRDVLDWASEHNGLLVENYKSQYNQDVSEGAIGDTLEGIREETLVRHLNQYILNMEEKWTENNDEMLEVFVSLSDYVFDSLIEGTVASLLNINKRRSKLP